MRHLRGFAIAAASAAIAWTGGASAQDGEPTTIVEIFTCNFVNGSDMDDLNAFIENFNEWADEAGITSYSAITLTPYNHSDQFAFDVGWAGVFPNGQANGETETIYLTQGGDIADEFAEVIDCPTHANYAAIPVHQPDSGPDDDESDVPGYISFTDSAIREGRTAGEAIGALGEYGDYLAENGSDLFSAVLFPLDGERDDIDYNFKNVRAFPNPSAYGDYLDVWTSGGFMRANQIMGRVIDCDSPRIYITNNVRQAAPQD